VNELQEAREVERLAKILHGAGEHYVAVHAGPGAEVVAWDDEEPEDQDVYRAMAAAVLDGAAAPACDCGDQAQSAGRLGCCLALTGFAVWGLALLGFVAALARLAR
jgi:hypothetical protein